MKKGQTQIQNTVTLLFIIVGVIVVAILASATTPFLILMAISNNITGGMGLIVRYWNLVLVTVLMFIGLIIVFSGGRTQ